MGGKVAKYFETKESRRRIRLISFVTSVVLTIIMAWIFYSDVKGVMIFPFVYYLIFKYFEDDDVHKEKARFLREYQEFLNGVVSWISSGLSVEKAFVREEEEFRSLIGEKSALYKALKRINSKVDMNIPIEKAFYEFATEIDLEEVWEFAEIFVFSKRLGNDYSKNLKLCADRIGSKLELRGEIETSIVEKQMEMKVMCILPIILLVFLKLSAADFIGVLYGNLAGKLVMTVALAMYVSGVVLSYVIVKKGEDI